MFNKRGFGSEDEEVHVDLSPMIDCLFILLIFFIVTTTFVNPHGLEVNKPEASGASALEKQSVYIGISKEDDVDFEGKLVGVKGIRSALGPALQGKDEVTIIIDADKDASHGTVQRVHGEAKVAAQAANIPTVSISVTTKN